MGTVDSGICCFFGGVQVDSDLFTGREWPWEATWKNWGKAMELNFFGKSVVRVCIKAPS